ncbi:Uu.00g032620.m01.CDS01 [Anthostomella pinea]|uniref:Uu.00g032620.m01.CDS01 n=1 Tax=Anthostomella pinea TaxID=933095 RepID=A0AAI8V8K1_9PEZI|nr:Uu.00g032620.m01.CDS01 [Anthostomella pinea]
MASTVSLPIYMLFSLIITLIMANRGILSVLLEPPVTRRQSLERVAFSATIIQLATYLFDKKVLFEPFLTDRQTTTPAEKTLCVLFYACTVTAMTMATGVGLLATAKLFGRNTMWPTYASRIGWIMYRTYVCVSGLSIGLGDDWVLRFPFELMGWIAFPFLLELWIPILETS